MTPTKVGYLFAQSSLGGFMLLVTLWTFFPEQIPSYILFSGLGSVYFAFALWMVVHEVEVRGRRPIVSDQRLRELERRVAQGDQIAEVGLLGERIRSGGLDQRRVTLAAYLGHETSRGIVSIPGPGFPRCWPECGEDPEHGPCPDCNLNMFLEGIPKYALWATGRKVPCPAHQRQIVAGVGCSLCDGSGQARESASVEIMVRCALAAVQSVLHVHEAPKPLTEHFPNLGPSDDDDELSMELYDTRSLCSACGGRDPDCTNVCDAYWGPRRVARTVEAWLKSRSDEHHQGIACRWTDGRLPRFALDLVQAFTYGPMGGPSSGSEKQIGRLKGSIHECAKLSSFWEIHDVILASLAPVLLGDPKA